ncbi:hypothetical protein DICSQDRAFT_140732 [Dichomitus squalens LYAD-421 SS1]|uniref:Uncharacterized protein n=1 Tax=Dichomitus squalens (strain LYAD-421) TaxID=732165 RepID=R7SPR0_DICSQ|nr:uncharacterized protein DICSQDRAFT_140732 [Dichomitus squalens LYAD-421 SS1]EJF56972.1 hypothetical protein DICSQDRAFT_140732 [Dichomitus squalens LYAD-421 SS1]
MSQYLLRGWAKQHPGRIHIFLLCLGRWRSQEARFRERIFIFTIGISPGVQTG